MRKMQIMSRSAFLCCAVLFGSTVLYGMNPTSAHAQCFNAATNASNAAVQAAVRDARDHVQNILKAAAR